MLLSATETALSSGRESAPKPLYIFTPVVVHGCSDLAKSLTCCPIVESVVPLAHPSHVRVVELPLERAILGQTKIVWNSRGGLVRMR